MINHDTTEESPNQPPIYDLFGVESSSELLGFNKRRIPHTVSPPTPKITPQPQAIQYSELAHWQRRYLQEYELSQGFDVGVSLSLYPSGEFSGACTALGPKTQGERKPRGPNSSTDLTPTARKSMRRAIENHWRPFTRMITLTFDPSQSQLNEDGTVNHEWANNKVNRLLATLSQKHSRLHKRTGKRQFDLSYIRVSEVQPQTGNIHYHILVDRHVDIGYLVGLWGQASNSVDIKKISGMRGLNYLLKYIKKDKHLIYGKRYAISENLYGEFKPCKISITGRHARTIFLSYMQSNATTLLNGHGYLGDWGFCIPPPSRDGVPSSKHRAFILGLAQELSENGYPEFLSTLLGMEI